MDVFIREVRRPTGEEYLSVINELMKDRKFFEKVFNFI
jgi:hypothetical protein